LPSRSERHAIWLPSGLQLALKSEKLSNVSCRLFEPSAFITHSSPVGPRPPLVHTIRLPSGENSAKSSSALSLVRFWGFEPSACITQMSNWPPRLLTNAMGPCRRAANAGDTEHASRSTAIQKRAPLSAGLTRNGDRSMRTLLLTGVGDMTSVPLS